MFVFRVWERASESAEWVPSSQLLVHVDDGGNQVSTQPTQLSWITEDGTQYALGFSPDMASFYGYRRAAGDDVTQVRGELEDRRDLPERAPGARGYEFETQVQNTDGWHPAGRLRVLIESGSEAPVRSVAWHDQSGDARSLTLRTGTSSGSADISSLVGAVRASAEHRGANEVAANLVLASRRKWFAWQNHASLEFELTEPVVVERYMLTSANDAPDRDPAAWTLRGSADGRLWRTLDTRSGQSFAHRHLAQTYQIAEPGSFDRYRLEITRSNGSQHLQLETVRFLADSSGVVGFRQCAGHAPVAYRGIRVVEAPAQGPALSPRSRGSRGAEWVGWQPGGPWLPLGGSLSMESLTSPSGRFTALHSGYEPSFAVRDNLTYERVWTSDVPRSSLVCLGPDGDLAAWDHHANRLWSTGTGWLGVRRLEMRDSGELALTGADGAVLWSSGIPLLPAAQEAQAQAVAGLRRVARGSTMRRGESLYAQSLTSEDGSTVLHHDGVIVRVTLEGEGSHWHRHYEQQTVLALDEDGFLRSRTLDGIGTGTVVEEIAGPGDELTIVRGAAELRDGTGAVVWASRSTRAPSVRLAAIPRAQDLAGWFGALVGADRGYCVAVVKESTPEQVLESAGLPQDSTMRGTWSEFQRHRDAAHSGEGSVVTAIAVGPDVLVIADDVALPVATLAPSSSVAALQVPKSGNGYGTTFSVHHEGTLVSEIRDEPRRLKGANVPEVAAALDEIAHPLHRHELLFRTVEVVPGAAELGGPLLGGVLAPTPAPSAAAPAGPAEVFLAIGEYDSMDQFVVRTDFTDEDAWNLVVEQLREPWMENEPSPCLISEPGYDGASAERVLKDIRATMSDADMPAVLFIADSMTMREKDHPLLVVSMEWDGEPFEDDEEPFITQYRTLPDAAVEISVNLGIANMDFEDFADESEPHERFVD